MAHDHSHHHSSEARFEAFIRNRMSTDHPSDATAPDHCPEMIELAAWIDGRLPANEQDRVDAHLARCRSCLEAVRAARDVLTETEKAAHAPAVSASLDERERLIAALDESRTALRFAKSWDTSEVDGPLFTIRPLSRGRIAAAAAIIAAVCWFGFQAGHTTSTSGPEVEIDSRAAMTFGLLAPDAESDAMLSLLAVWTERTP